jgi:hypothetical protein
MKPIPGESISAFGVTDLDPEQSKLEAERRKAASMQAFAPQNPAGAERFVISGFKVRKLCLVSDACFSVFAAVGRFLLK